MLRDFNRLMQPLNLMGGHVIQSNDMVRLKGRPPLSPDGRNMTTSVPPVITSGAVRRHTTPQRSEERRRLSVPIWNCVQQALDAKTRHVVESCLSCPRSQQ